MAEPIPTPRRASVRSWARHNGIDYGAARAFVSRAVDPLPHLRIGRRILVDVLEAEAWLRRQDSQARANVGEIVDEIIAQLEVKA